MVVAQPSTDAIRLDMMKNFQNPPVTASPWTFWQWMNGHITPEGITLDLEAMKRMGIGGALCFNNGVGIPRGPVDFASPEWMSMTEHAASEANRLGLKLMLHNSPGYSGTGGPWVTPEMSMQQLSWSEVLVKNSRKINIKLPKPYAKEHYYKDAFVIAYPSLPVEQMLMKNALMQMEIDGKIVDKQILTDANPDTKIRLEASQTKTSVVVLTFKKAFEARAIAILRKAETPKDLFDGPRDHPPVFVLESSDDGMNFRFVTRFSCSELREMNTPSGEVFAPVKAKYYRLTTSNPTWLSDVELSQGPRLAGWFGKTNWTRASSSGQTPIVQTDLCINPEKVIDITKCMDASGQLRWTAPTKGNWTILRIGSTTTGEEPAAHPESGKGLEIDKFRKDALDLHFEKFIDKVVDKLKPYIGKSFIGFTTDSWEAGKQNWTPRMPEEFKQRRKYALINWLPALTGRIVGSVDETERFLWDFRKTCADLLAENYYGYWATLCHARGLQYHAEPYGDGAFDSMQSGQYLDVPMSEFWTRYIYGSTVTSKQAASLAHLYAKPIVAAESFTAMPTTSKWTDYPYSLKAQGDWLFTMGINRLIFHVFVHQPYTTAKPGMTMGPFGTHFDRNNTWTDQAYGWTNYLKRAQSLLQNGLFVADICYFKGDEPASGIPDIYPLMPEGFVGDVVSPAALHDRFVIKDNKIVLPDGMQYRACMMAPLDAMLPSSLQQIKELVAQGMILVVNNKPTKSLGRTYNDKEIQDIANELYGNLDGKTIKKRAYGNGEIYWGIPLNDILKENQIEPDFTFEGENRDAVIHYIHKDIDGKDLYMIANHRRRTEKIHCSFRVSDKQPEIWNAQNGEIYQAANFDVRNNRTELILDLEPAGSLFVLFDKAAEKPQAIKVIKDGQDVTTVNIADKKADIYRDVQNNFTISAWVKPDTYAHGGKSMLFHAPEGEIIYGAGHAACGLGVGQNGVFLYECTKGSAKQVLSSDKPLTGWSHIAVVYSTGKPMLYVNGELFANGKPGANIIHPGLSSLPQQSQFISYFEGNYTVPELIRLSLSSDKIKELYAKGLPNPITLSSVELKKTDAGNTQLTIRENGTYKIQTNAVMQDLGQITACKILPVNENWKVRFPKHCGAPDSINLPVLKSLHLNADFNVKHFSGTATYLKNIEIPNGYFSADQRIIIDMGRVEVIAELLVNAKPVDILWKEPFRADITSFVKPGQNEIEIRVTNLWPNRMIGDEFLPVENEYSKDKFIFKLPEWYTSNQSKSDDRITFCTWKSFSKEDPLLESGLLGPAFIRTEIIRILK